MGGITKGCVREVTQVSLAQVSLCGSAHSSGCVVNGLGAMAAH